MDWDWHYYKDVVNFFKFLVRLTHSTGRSLGYEGNWLLIELQVEVVHARMTVILSRFKNQFGDTS